MLYICIFMIISQTMMKLTHSFCRYTKLTCDKFNFNTTHVKKYLLLSCGRRIYVTLYAQKSIVDSFTHTHQQLRLLTDIKGEVRLKETPHSSREAQVSNKMEDYEDQIGNILDFDASDSSTSSDSDESEDIDTNDHRKWEKVAQRQGRDRFRFKVVSYNVLAQYLLECHPYLYSRCNHEDLSWKVRFERLFKEIMDVDPDIICLQEVQMIHYHRFFGRFKEAGYYGIYKQKTHDKQDGCAIYFKMNVFNMRDHFSVEFYQPDIPLLDRDNVGLMLKLVPYKYPYTPFVVATTHLLYNPRRTDVRLAQLQVLLAELDRFAYFENYISGTTGHYPIILTGDFNSRPHSEVVQLLDYGKVNASCDRDASDWRRIGVTDNCQHLTVHLNRPRGRYSDFRATKLYHSEVRTRICDYHMGRLNRPRRLPPLDKVTLRHNFLFNTGRLRSPLSLISVYEGNKLGGNKEATTFQDFWVTVDYIYYSNCQDLRLLDRLRLPTRRECEFLGSLPNDVYGSDHLMLAAHFELQ